MKKILIDSDALFRMYTPQDPHHGTALSIFKKLDEEKASLYVTNLVIYESATLFSNRISHKIAVTFVKNILASNIKQIILETPLLDKAMVLFLSQTKNNISFVDCSNVVAYKQFNLDNIFSFDKFYGTLRLTL